MEDRNAKILCINEQIAKLQKERSALLMIENRSFKDIKDRYAEEVDAEWNNDKSTRLLFGYRKDAWDAMRKLALCAPVDEDLRNNVKKFTDEEYMKAREFLEKLVDFYLENRKQL